ncbi:MAG: Neutral ceramidase, partial [Paenibacillus sp.]|nr:Neutral ceramidase [Paenibacillus sp.]
MREVFQMIRCGMSEVIITPPLGCSMPGYFHDRRSTGILDELYAKAVVWESNTDMAAIIALDCIDLTRPIVEAIRSQVRAGTGISESCVMVSATHTHTGPPVKTTTFLQDDQAYLDWMIERAAEAAITAYHSRQEAIIGVGLGQEDRIAFNRRFFMQDGTVRTNPGIGNPHIVRPTGPIDPQVIVLRIDDTQGRPIGVITNYATHTDVVGGTEYSGDYPGELSVAIKEALGSQTVSMFLMGASGNINHYNVVSGKASDYVKPSDYYRRMGRILAAEVLRVREAANTDNGQKLSLHTRQATVT